jgi:hypothetical protein
MQMVDREPTHDTHGGPGADEDADTASGGAPDAELPDTTDENDRPVDNPSG